MNYATALLEYELVLLESWFAEAGELATYLEFPHSAGSGDLFLVASVADFQNLLAAVAWPELEVWIWRQRAFPLRGLAGPGLLQQARATLVDGIDWVIVAPPTSYPAKCVLYCGDTVAELEEGLAEFHGKMIWLGPDPREQTERGNAEFFSFVLGRRWNVRSWPPVRPEVVERLGQDPGAAERSRLYHRDW